MEDDEGPAAHSRAVEKLKELLEELRPRKQEEWSSADLLHLVLHGWLGKNRGGLDGKMTESKTTRAAKKYHNPTQWDPEVKGLVK